MRLMSLQGGLDCRYLASRIRPTAFKVLSVTTISTPHHGSVFADYFIDTLGKARIPSLVSFLDYLPNGGGDGKAFEGLTLESMKKFNEEVIDAEGVQYFSWGAKCSPGLVDAFRYVNVDCLANFTDLRQVATWCHSGKGRSERWAGLRIIGTMGTYQIVTSKFFSSKVWIG